MQKILSVLFAAFRNSLNGFKKAGRDERAVRQELCLLVVSVPLACFIAPGWLMAVLLIGSLLIILAVELLNTGIEKLCDHVTPEHHPVIGYVKDLGSAAVLCTLLFAALVWGGTIIQFLAGRGS